MNHHRDLLPFLFADSINFVFGRHIIIIMIHTREYNQLSFGRFASDTLVCPPEYQILN